MNVTCPNCGQKTEATDCPWCHYPLVVDPAATAKRNNGPAWTLVSRIIESMLVLVIVALVFLQLSPDYGIYIVRSQSMTPNIRMGDIIITGPAKGEIRPGTIVTYKREKELITHRVQSVEGDKLVTRGDAVEEADPWPVNISDVKGIYMFKITYLGYLPYFARTKLGWFLVIILPTAVLVGFMVKDIVKEALKP